MKAKYGYVLCLWVLLFSSTKVSAQVFDDWEGRMGIAAKYEWNNGIQIRARYRHHLGDDLSHYKGSSLGLKMGYEFRMNKWLKPAIDYRYKYNDEGSRHDIRYSIAFSRKLGRNFVLTYAAKIQQIIASDKHPQFYFRNDAELMYAINDNWSVFLFTENYQRVGRSLHFDAQKTGLGAAYMLNRFSGIEFKMDVKSKSSHDDIARLSLGYTFLIQ